MKLYILKCIEKIMNKDIKSYGDEIFKIAKKWMNSGIFIEILYLLVGNQPRDTSICVHIKSYDTN